MHYEINVSLNGNHLFATHERSLHTEEQARMVYRLFAEKFEEFEGYKITVTRYEDHGTIIDFARQSFIFEAVNQVAKQLSLRQGMPYIFYIDPEVKIENRWVECYSDLRDKLKNCGIDAQFVHEPEGYVKATFSYIEK